MEINRVSGEMVLRWARYGPEDLVGWAARLETVAAKMRANAREKEG